MDDLPMKLKIARVKRDLTQAEAAAVVGVSRRTWVEWEQGGTPQARFNDKVATFIKESD